MNENISSECREGLAEVAISKCFSPINSAASNVVFTKNVWLIIAAFATQQLCCFDA